MLCGEGQYRAAMRCPRPQQHLQRVADGPSVVAPGMSADVAIEPNATPRRAGYIVVVALRTPLVGIGKTRP